MNIVFFNIANIGDSFIVQEIIKHTCRENPTLPFSIFTSSNSFLFENIPNLTILLPNTHYSKQLESHDNSFFFLDIQNDIYPILRENGMKPFFLLNDTTIAINTWVGAFTKYLAIEELECDIQNIQYAFTQIFHEIQELVSIQYTPLESLQLVPELPFQPIESFDIWYQLHKDKPLIFYYNYEGRSGQSMISSEEEHNFIILNLASQFPSMLFLLPRCSPALKEYVHTYSLLNIIDCREKFLLIETSNCKNLVDLSYISSHCNFSVHFDIGACYFFLNKEHLFKKSKNTIIHLGKRTFFYEKFNKLLKNTNTPLVKSMFFAICQNWKDVLGNVSTLLQQ